MRFMAMIVINSYKIASIGVRWPVTRSDTAFAHNDGMKDAGFGERLRLACEAAGVPATQAALSRLFGVSTTIVWHYLNGEKLPSMAKAILIATKLGVCVEWLLTGRGPMHPPPSPGDVLDISRLPPTTKNHLKALVDALSPPTSQEQGVKSA